MVFPFLIHGTRLFQFVETRLRTMIERRDPFWTNVKLVLHLTPFTNENNLKEWQCWFDSFQRPIFWPRIFVVCVWRQRSSCQDDHNKMRPDNETCFQHIQSCFLRFNRINLDLKYKSNALIPITNLFTFQPKKFTWWMKSFLVFVWY